jgi:hypothetical protein
MSMEAGTNSSRFTLSGTWAGASRLVSIPPNEVLPLYEWPTTHPELGLRHFGRSRVFRPGGKFPVSPLQGRLSECRDS